MGGLEREINISASFLVKVQPVPADAVPSPTLRQSITKHLEQHRNDAEDKSADKSTRRDHPPILHVQQLKVSGSYTSRLERHVSICSPGEV